MNGFRSDQKCFEGAPAMIILLVVPWMPSSVVMAQNFFLFCYEVADRKISLRREGDPLRGKALVAVS
jgi:hypothetical protein